MCSTKFKDKLRTGWIPQAANNINNDYKWFRLQEAEESRLTYSTPIHTRMHAWTHAVVGFKHMGLQSSFKCSGWLNVSNFMRQGSLVMKWHFVCMLCWCLNMARTLMLVNILRDYFSIEMGSASFVWLFSTGPDYMHYETSVGNHSWRSRSQQCWKDETEHCIVLVCQVLMQSGSSFGRLLFTYYILYIYIRHGHTCDALNNSTKCRGDKQCIFCLGKHFSAEVYLDIA